MPKTITAALAALAGVAFAALAATEIHQWRDADGQVHFGDRPPPDADAQQIEVRPNVYTAPSIEGLDDPGLRPPRVVMYSAGWCGVCDRARDWMREHAIAFDEYDIEHSRKGRRDYKRLKARGVPVILIGDQRMNGFSASKLQAMLEAEPPRSAH
jgi:glutaredoxin